jgi:ssDNA-specific exonuclease RecJ
MGHPPIGLAKKGSLMYKSLANICFSKAVDKGYLYNTGIDPVLLKCTFKRHILDVLYLFHAQRPKLMLSKYLKLILAHTLCVLTHPLFFILQVFVDQK